ncbi:MAG: DUF4747 family protein [Bacteroidetes bacterium]|nr:MAG: DUF4747 family protein [Bacteroidota bacterium]
MGRKPKLKITVDYYTLNVKVLPATNGNTKRYESLLLNWYNNGYGIMTPGDKRHYYSLRKLDKVDDGKVYYGVVTKYVSFENIDFVDKITQRLIPHPIPDNAEARVSEHEFVFIPEKHRFAIIKVGKIDPDIKKSGAPLNKMKEVIKVAFDNGLEVGEHAVVEVEQEQFVFDEILASNLLSLQFRVSYTNDDVLPEGKKLMDSLMKENHIGDFFGRLKPDNTGKINTEKGMTRGLLELAKDNGMVKAVIENEEGRKNVNSLDYPSINSADSEKGAARFINFLRKIYNNITGKNNGESETAEQK